MGDSATAPPDIEPDRQQRWAEKWLLLSLAGRSAAARAAEGAAREAMTGDQLARALGAKQVTRNGD